MPAKKKSPARLRLLKEEALERVSEKKYAKAADLYGQLTKFEPHEGEWPRRAADCYWHLKNPDKRLEFSLLAAAAYSEAGHLLKAIAMCKVVLSLDPEHRETQARLADLHARRQRGGARLMRRGRSRTGGGTEAAALPEGAKERKAEKAQHRLAAATALRKARAERRRAELKARKRPIQSPVQAPPTEEAAPSGDAAPPLHLEAPPSSRRHPALDAMVLSERLPNRTRQSAPPSQGNIYSLTTGEMPDAEVIAGRIPSVRLPQPSAPAPDGRRGAVHADEPPDVNLEFPPPSLAPRLANEFGLQPSLTSDRRQMVQRDFADIPLLSEVEPAVLRELITDVALVELDAGEVLFNEGDVADAMYVVVEGSVVAMTLPRGGKAIQLAHLEEGEFFGEIGLLSDQPRGASVSAHEPCRLLRFDREVVSVLVDHEPGFLATLLHFLRGRLVDNLMVTNPLFGRLSEGERAEVAEQFEFLEVEANSLLLDRGQPAIGMYVLLTGEAVLEGASAPGTVRRLGPGDIVGEQALLRDELSAIRVRTASKCFALCLPCDAFVELIVAHPEVAGYLNSLEEDAKGEMEVTEEFLDHVTFF